jgi:hypothetical protein
VTTAITRAQRFSRFNPCPVCGGSEADRRHRGTRCFGYLSLDVRLAFCTREEYAGSLDQNLASGTYTHRLAGDCGCGNRHDGSRPRRPQANTGRNPFDWLAALDTGPVRTVEYTIRDIDGRPQAVHVREEFADGDKTFAWRRLDGRPGLGGRPVSSLPLYGSELLKNLYTCATVVVCEGEKAADHLRSFGYVAIATVTGARGCPDAEVLESLRGFSVVYWPDFDDLGLDHVVRMWRQVPGRFVVWPDAPESGDAADVDDESEIARLVAGAVDPRRIDVEFSCASGHVVARPMVEEKAAPQNERPGPDTDRLRHRLADGLERLGDAERAQAMRTCGERFRVRRCINGHRPAFPVSCGSQLCPRCGPRKLARDWRNVLYLPDGLRLVELRSLAAYDDDENLFGTVRGRFRKWRHAKILNAVYGARLEATADGLRPVVLLVLPGREQLPDGGRAFSVTTIAEGATAREAVDWLQHHYLDEADAWRTDEELALLQRESKKRRRFQAFGVEFAKGGSYAQYADGDEGRGEESAPTGRNSPPSGGTGRSRGGRDEPVCPICGGGLEAGTGFTVSREEVLALPNGKGFVLREMRR